MSTTDAHGNELAPSYVWDAVADKVTPAEIGGPDTERSRVVHKAVRAAVDAVQSERDKAARALGDAAAAHAERWQRQAEHLASELARCHTDYAEREHHLTREARHLDWRCNSLAARLDAAETYTATADRRADDADDEARLLAEKCDAAEYERDIAVSRLGSIGNALRLADVDTADLPRLVRLLRQRAEAAEQERDDLRKLHTETRNANRGLARRLEFTEQERADAARLVETLRAENHRLTIEAADAEADRDDVIAEADTSLDQRDRAYRIAAAGVIPAATAAAICLRRRITGGAGLRDGDTTL